MEFNHKSTAIFISSGDLEVIIRMLFDVDGFVANPSKTKLYGLTKSQLKQAVDKIGLEYDTNAKKVELWQILLDHFIEKDLISEEHTSAGNSDVEIKGLELEHQAQEQQREQECRLKMKELELREKELEVKDKEMQLQVKLK